MSELWYTNGLRFSCSMCGSCCSMPPELQSFVFVSPQEVEQIAKFLGWDVEKFIQVYTVKLIGVFLPDPADPLKFKARPAPEKLSLVFKPNGECVFLTADKKCQIHLVKPRQCVAYPFWGQNVRNEEAWKATCKECPGCGQGELIPSEEITRRLKEIEL